MLFIHNQPMECIISSSILLGRIRLFMVRSLFFMIALSAMSATLETGSFPVPIPVDHEPVRSSLLIKCRFKRYDMPFPQFQNQDLDQTEQAFSRLVVAIKGND